MTLCRFCWERTRWSWLMWFDYTTRFHIKGRTSKNSPKVISFCVFLPLEDDIKIFFWGMTSGTLVDLFQKWCTSSNMFLNARNKQSSFVFFNVLRSYFHPIAKLKPPTTVCHLFLFLCSPCNKFKATFFSSNHWQSAHCFGRCLQFLRHFLELKRLKTKMYSKCAHIY